MNVRIATNDVDRLNAVCRRHSVALLDAIELPFHNDLPADTIHRAAHNKLTLLDRLATGQYGEQVGIVDLDVVFLRPPLLPSTEDPRALLVYDITHQMMAESDGRAARDCRLVADEGIASPRWFGGEILIGDRHAVATLCEHVHELYPRYLANMERLHHVGDETVVSSALNAMLKHDLINVKDLGELGIVERWWTARRKFSQPRFAEIVKRPILHLPADKEFLSAAAADAFTAETFLSKYSVYARRKLLARRLIGPVYDRIRGQSPMFVARM